MPKPEYIEDNVRLVKAFKPLPDSEMRELSTTLSQKNKTAMDLFFSRHVDC
jgi:hypothetical protein